MSTFSIKELIEKLSPRPYNSSRTWVECTKDLRHYLEHEDLELYHLHKISPPVFYWPEDGSQNKIQLDYLLKDTESVVHKALYTNTYGPLGIQLCQNIQLDRVQQIWTLYNLIKFLNLNPTDNEVFFEFGAGTGQMADVLAELKFQGPHVIYDLPLMTVLQKYFIEKQGITNQHLIDEEGTTIQRGTNFLANNQPAREAYVMSLPNINFVATYSLSETDAETHAKFATYMPFFSRIYIVYWPGKHDICDGVDNTEYIEQIKKDINSTHTYKEYDNFGNGKVFLAVKKEILPEITSPLPN
jgi:hypothetical protein